MTPFSTGSIPGVLGAFAAGVLSFLSPCVLPLVPAYLSFISGESASAIGSGSARKARVFRGTLLFALGFTLVFTALALAFGGGMRFVGSGARAVVNRVAGLVVIALALNVILDFIPFLRVEARFHGAGSAGSRDDSARERALSALRSVLVGMAFAAGWTPCVGPILSSILLLAGESGDPVRATTLLLAYSVGLAVPFILAGFFLDRAKGLLAFFKRHYLAVRVVTGLLLLAFGIALLAGSLSRSLELFSRAASALEGIAETGPAWLRPVAAFLARWLLFRGA